MDNLTTIRLDLGINAQKMMQQVHLNNKLIEDHIQRGIELALDDITKEDNLVEAIREATTNELISVVNQTVLSWELKNKISKIVEQKLGEKLEEYANTVVEKLTKDLKL